MGISKRLIEEAYREALDLLEECGSLKEACRKSGIPRSTLSDRIRRAREYFDYKVPEGQSLKGISTLYDNEGNVKAQWVKTDKEIEDRLDSIREAVEALSEEIKPLPIIKSPDIEPNSLMAEYILTDLHLGMLAESSEVGEDWNVGITEKTVEAWISSAMESAPACEQAVFVQLGDFQHFSSMEPVTPASRHLLDASCRPNSMIKSSVKLMVRCINKLLEKHQKVHVIIADANHDPYGQCALRAFLPILYQNEPRVTIDESESTYYCFEFGQVSCFYHHGHKRGLKDISRVFAGYFRDVFGRTKYSYGKIGHFHHTARSEDSLMQVEIMPTLAPSDAYAHKAGYKSNRGAVTVIYHKEHGEVQRITTSPYMVM